MQQFGWTEEQFQTNFQLLPESEAIIYPERKPDKDSQMNYNLDPGLYKADQPGMPNPCRPRPLHRRPFRGRRGRAAACLRRSDESHRQRGPGRPCHGGSRRDSPWRHGPGLPARSSGTPAQELDRHIQMRSVESNLALTQLAVRAGQHRHGVPRPAGGECLFRPDRRPAARAMVAEGPFGPNLQASVPWQRMEMSPQVVEAPPALTTLPEVITELSVKQEKLENFSRAVGNFQCSREGASPTMTAQGGKRRAAPLPGCRELRPAPSGGFQVGADARSADLPEGAPVLAGFSVDRDRRPARDRGG